MQASPHRLNRRRLTAAASARAAALHSGYAELWVTRNGKVDTGHLIIIQPNSFGEVVANGESAVSGEAGCSFQRPTPHQRLPTSKSAPVFRGAWINRGLRHNQSSDY
jgi:hypothetical protein